MATKVNKATKTAPVKATKTAPIKATKTAPVKATTAPVTPTKKQLGFVKQSASLTATMALTNAQWQRGLVCLTGVNANKCVKNPRQAGSYTAYGLNWYNKAQKTRMAKTLFSAAKMGKYPTYSVGGNTYQLAMGLPTAKRNKLQLVGNW